MWQINPLNGKLRLVDCYENSDETIHYYFPFVGQPIDSQYAYSDADMEAIQVFKNFKKPIHFGDPDVAKRSIQAKEKKSTRRILFEIGVSVQSRPESNDFITRREKTKVWLQRGIEVNDTPRTQHYMECIKNARYPARTETSQATGPVMLPIHDWTSHHRTGTEYLCVNLDVPTSFTKPPQTTQERVQQQLQRQGSYDEGDGIND